MKQNAVLLSALEKSFLAIYTFTTLIRRTSGGTRGVTEFNLTHMPTAYCLAAGERRMVFHGQGIFTAQMSLKTQSICIQDEKFPN